jgi:Zn-dependent M28 family amino/carboxypeptidase
VTAEEDGLLGSEYLVRHPPFPRDALVADVNMDLLPWYPISGFCARGAEHSTLGRDARAAADALGVALLPDGIPKQVYFVRSDQLSFIREGIPALFVGGAYGDETFVEYRRTRYHDPADEWDPRYDYESMAKIARAVFLIGLSVASAPERARWNPGDLFERVAAERHAALRR